MPTLLFATRNKGKIRELRQLFADLPDLTLITLDDVPPVAEVDEDGETFEDNARKKALEYALATGHMCLSDDSGLEVDALGGAPGVHSARYSGIQGDDVANNAKLLAELARAPTESRTARYRVVLALADPKGLLGSQPHTEVGTCEGRIRMHPSGEGGFGYDPYFEPDGFTRTMAELASDEKNAISHRGLASRKMHAFLAGYLATRARENA
jgi:XTP/dITP diphosphohydrolase